MSKRSVTLTVNGLDYEVWVEPSELLLDVLHDQIGQPDVRYGCGEGVCGTCTVQFDGEPVSACLLFAVQAEGHRITTVTGLCQADGALHPLQQSFLDHGGSQCGFCTPGMVLTADCLARRGERPSREAIRYELVGNLCRCTGYTKILDAVEEYVDSVSSGEGRL